MARSNQFWDVVKSLLSDKNLNSDDHISINDKNKIADNEVNLAELFVLFCTMYFHSLLNNTIKYQFAIYYFRLRQPWLQPLQC